MFNAKLKKDALLIHEKAEKNYNSSYDEMMQKCQELYQEREKAVELAKKIEDFINSIANTPKEFDKKMGLIREDLKQFKETEQFAKEALEGELKAGVGVAAAAGAGIAFAGMAPSVAMQIATTFGVASTGRAISTLSGAVAKKAALAWLGGGALAAGGGGIAGGQALLALAGPIGWGIAGAGEAVSLIGATRKNKKVSDEAVENAKKLMSAKEELDETRKRIEYLSKKTESLREELKKQVEECKGLYGANYGQLEEWEQKLLGAIVMNTLTLTSLLNEIIE